MIAALCLLLSAMMAAAPLAPSAQETLTAQMLLAEIARDGTTNRSSGINYAGQCKRFQVDTFEMVASGYQLALYPGATLFMPLEHAEEKITGRPVGTCWDMPDPSTGNAFVEIARFDYDQTVSQKENLEAARRFLQGVQAGDVMQMLATFSGGTARGTHTLMFTRPYDPRLQKLYWVDSNLDNYRVEGVRYGIAHAYQQRDLEEVASWLAWDWHNGATLYRINDSVEPRK